MLSYLHVIFSTTLLYYSSRHLPYVQSGNTYLPGHLENIDNKLLDLTKQILTKTLFFGSNSFDVNTKTNALNTVVEKKFLIKT